MILWDIVNFSINFVGWNVKKVQQGKIRCQVVFCEEINSIFSKMTKKYTEIQKISKIFRVSRFF